MEHAMRNNTLARLAGAAAVVALDQIAKHLARTLLTRGSPVEVIPGFFNLTLVFNQGAAWGMLAGFRYGFIALAFAMLALVVFRHDAIFGKGRLGAVSSTLLCGGIVGNLIDRIATGRVTDFLDFWHGSYHFPCFNVADSAISVGIALFFVASFAVRPTRESE